MTFASNTDSTRSGRGLVALLLVLGILAWCPAGFALESGGDGGTSVSAAAGGGLDHALPARDTVDVEDHSTYSTEYIFGMTKGVMRSTLTPALKPVILLVTVPLDIAFLPFAAIGGFFR